MESLWLKYGVLGAVIIAMGIIVKILWNKLESIEAKHKAERDEWLQMHLKERTEWRSTIETQFGKIEERDEKHDSILKDIKFLLRIRKPKNPPEK